LIDSKGRDFCIGDHVFLTGTLSGNEYGTGSTIQKNGVSMYVVALSARDNGSYCLGLGYSIHGMRVGWARPEDIIKLPAVKRYIFREKSTEVKPQKFSTRYVSTYIVSNNLGTKLRYAAGSYNKEIAKIPYGTYLECNGQYTTKNGKRWLYVTCEFKNIRYTGFCPMNNLKECIV